MVRSMRFATLLVGVVLVGHLAEPGPRAPRIEAAEDLCWRKAEALFAGQTAWRRAGPGKVRLEQPQAVRRAKPEFPKEASQSGCLHMLHEVLVAPSGDVVAVWTIPPAEGEGCPDFEEAAAVAFRKSKYTPGRAGQNVVPFCLTIGTTVDVR